MTIKIELVVEGIDLTDDHVLEMIGLHLADVAWSTSSGITTATLFADEPDEIDAAWFTEELSLLLPQARVVRVHDDLVGASEIAARVGVSRQAVHAWVSGDRGEGDFPTPIGVISGGARPTRIWRWREVNRWLEARALGDGFAYPQEDDVARLNAALAGPGATTVRPVWSPLVQTRPGEGPEARRLSVVWGASTGHGPERGWWHGQVSGGGRPAHVEAVRSPGHLRRVS